MTFVGNCFVQWIRYFLVIEIIISFKILTVKWNCFLTQNILDADVVVVVAVVVDFVVVVDVVVVIVVNDVYFFFVNVV